VAQCATVRLTLDNHPRGAGTRYQCGLHQNKTDSNSCGECHRYDDKHKLLGVYYTGSTGSIDQKFKTQAKAFMNSGNFALPYVALCVTCVNRSELPCCTVINAASIAGQPDLQLAPDEPLTGTSCGSLLCEGKHPDHHLLTCS